MSKDAAKPEGKPKGGKMKKMILIGVGATVLIGAGVRGALCLGRGSARRRSRT